MKKQTNKIRKTKDLILAVVVILGAILLFIALILLNIDSSDNKPGKTGYTKEDVKILQDGLADYMSDKVMPQGLSKLYGKYKGENELEDLYKKLKLFIGYLPNVGELAAKSKDNQDIISYYKSNDSEISKYMGITTQDEFVKFVNYLKDVGKKKKKYVSCKVQADTIEEVDDYLTFDLTITFENFDNEFKVKAHLANIPNANPLVYFSV